MARPEKVAAVKEITERFGGSDAALLTEYRGLTVAEIADVRNSLRAADADYKVLKNTLARIAVREVGLEELVDMLEGPTAIAFVRGDAAAAAKALDEAAKRFPVLVIKGGVLKGKVIDADQARRLAKLESREVLLSKMAMLFNQPAQQAVNVFAALLRDLGSMLAQVVEQKQSEAPAPAAEEPPAPAEDAPAEEAPAAPDATPQAAPEEAPEAAEPPAEVPEAVDQAAAAPEADSGETAEVEASNAEAPATTEETTDEAASEETPSTATDEEA
ncbi:MAG TPA: 50S ribosomal protein L10 [Actinomycetota bacterium]|nr:50S ribosomal protein L10 [Actinomycetota bacterium]